MDTSQFLSRLDSDASAVFHFRTIPEGGNNGKPRNYCGTFAECEHQLRKENDAGRGVFVVVNAGGTKATDINRVRAVFADCDEVGRPWVMCAVRGRDPHLVVESSPGKWHAYWLVSDLPLDRFKTTQLEIAKAFGTDSAVTDLPRVMRLPGFMHRKGDPTPVRVIAVNERDPYRTSDFAVRKWGVSQPDYQFCTPEPIPKGMRNETLFHIACKLARRGDTYTQIVTALQAIPIEGQMDSGEIAKTAQNALKRASQPIEFPTLAPVKVEPRTKNVADLMKREFPPVQWAINGILPEGVTILGGDPKVGKSWLSLQMCMAVVSGAPLWAGREPEKIGDALYLDLEGKDMRLQRRVSSVLPHFPTADLSRFHYQTEWERSETGVEYIRQWLQEHPNARMVVVDTLTAFKDQEKQSKKTIYNDDYANGAMFKDIGRDFNVAIVLVMHNRKAAADNAIHKLNATQGLAGSVDNILVLERIRGADACLNVDGRDIEEPAELAMNFKNCMWYSQGTKHDVQRSKDRLEVLNVINAIGGVGTWKDIHAALPERAAGAVKTMLSRMVKSGDIENNGGLYTAKNYVIPSLANLTSPT